jgi:hypothetical protein
MQCGAMGIGPGDSVGTSEAWHHRAATRPEDNFSVLASCSRFLLVPSPVSGKQRPLVRRLAYPGLVDDTWTRFVPFRPCEIS